MPNIPDWLVGLVAGIFLTCYVFGVTFHYLPSPTELFGDAGVECRHTEIKQKEFSTVVGNVEDHKELTADYEKDVNDCLLARYTGSLAAFTRWLVIATFLLAAFGFWQVIISRQTARRQLRAYVFVANAKIGRRDEMPGHIEIIFTLKNSGQTPAHDITVWADTMVTDNPLTVKLEGTKDPSVGKTNLPPGGKHSTSFYKVDFSPAQNLALYTNPQVAIMIWGEVRYIDAFKIKQRTKFRLIQRGGPEFRDKPLAFTDDGNEAT